MAARKPERKNSRELNERQRKVLYCIVREYIEKKKPVSSQQVLDVTNIEYSGATIRNDMKKLEHLGYIYQPHTSAGRIPTDKGLRFYFEEMLKLLRETSTPSVEVEVLRMIPLADPERILAMIGSVLERATKGYVVIEKPNLRNLRIVRVVLTPIAENYMVFSLLTELGVLKTTPMRVEEIPDWRRIEEHLNLVLRGHSVSEILEGKIEYFKGSQFLKLLESIISETRESYIELGFENLLSDDTLDTEDIKGLLEFLSDKRNLKEFLEGSRGEIVVKIGKEIGRKRMEKFAVFSGWYYKDSTPIGAVHLFTSKITKYDTNFRVMEYVLNRLSEYFTTISRR